MSPPDVRRIAAIGSPVLRNLEITYAYSLLAADVAARSGQGANWCTFATWASRQAGATIRGEDALDLLTDRLGGGSLLHPLRTFGRWLLRRGLFDSASRLGRLLGRLHTPFDAVELASDAVARGNRKVFEEIGYEFARWLEADDPAAFIASLRDGDPPDGQKYLKAAFTHYSAPSPGPQQLFFANLLIGLHEQTRLQPEICEALDAPYITSEELGRRLFPNRRPRVQRAAALVVGPVQGKLAELSRELITHALMTLSVPGRILLLGSTCSTRTPRSCARSATRSWRRWSRSFEPAGGVDRSGAIDWSDLHQRMHYIVHLFRVFHEQHDLFDAPFTPAAGGAVPRGRDPGRRALGPGTAGSGPSACPGGRVARARRGCARAGRCPVTSGSVLTLAARDQVDRVGPEADRAEHADQVDVAHDHPVPVERDRRRAGEADARRRSRRAARPRTPRRSPRGRRRTGSRRRSGRARRSRPWPRGSPRGRPSRRPAERAVAVAAVRLVSGPSSSGIATAGGKPSAAASVRRSARVSVTTTVGGALGAGALGGEQADRAGADDQHALARHPPAAHGVQGDRGRLDQRAGARLELDAVGERRREDHARGHRAVHVDDAGLGALGAQVAAAGAAAHADAAADRDLPHDAVARPRSRSRPRRRRRPCRSTRGRERSGTRRGPSGSRPASRRRSRCRCRRCRRRSAAISSSPSPGVGSGRSTSLELFVAVELDCAHVVTRIEQPSKELRTADDGDGTRQGIASRRE